MLGSRIALQADGEALAELATLNELGIVNAVLSNDSNAVLFGAQFVLRDSQ